MEFGLVFKPEIAQSINYYSPVQAMNLPSLSRRGVNPLNVESLVGASVYGSPPELPGRAVSGKPYGPPPHGGASPLLADPVGSGDEYSGYSHPLTSAYTAPSP